MYLNGSNLHQLEKSFSGPQNSLRNLCNEERDKVCKEVGNLEKELKDTKECWLRKVKKIFQYITSNFKTPYPTFKYKLELMKKDDPDYVTLKNSLDIDSKLSLIHI